VYTKYVDASGNKIDWAARAADQQNRFKTVDGCFENCRKALAKFD
jgi:hypothetical protein